MTQDNLEVEELVRSAAEQKTAAANRILFQALRNVELFFPLKIRQGEEKAKKATPLLRLPDGTHAMMLYTSKSHPDLTDTFAGGSLKEALAAALKMPALDWVIISNLASQWVAISKDRIASVLADLRPNGNVANSSAEALDTGSPDAMLEKLIAQAVHTTPERLSPPIGSVLRGREVYLELNAGKSNVDQLVMKTFSLQHLANVIRVYITRRRPGITYGGMTWEELQEMLRKRPQIQGVQVINDADDWVVFDRESLGLNGDDQ